MSEQPYRAAAKTKALESFVLKMRSAVDSSGRKPLELITTGTYRKRISLYQGLAEYWSDKTGPVLANGKPLEDEWRLKDYKEMSVSEKIAFNVENYIDDNKALDEELRLKLENAEKRVEQEKKDKENVSTIKTSAIVVIAERFFPPSSEAKENNEKETEDYISSSTSTSAEKTPGSAL